MTITARTARIFHSVFPFAALRTANRLVSSLPEGTVLKRSLFGYPMRFHPERGTVPVMLYLLGEKFLEDNIFIDGHIHPGMTVVDVGANLGYLPRDFRWLLELRMDFC